MLNACHCEARVFGIPRDEIDDYRQKFREALEWSDILVTTAGVSVGPHDLVGKVVAELAGQVHFHRVAVRPGKPMMVTTFGDKVHFGLPGNPVSTCANTEIFIKPFLRKTFGIEPVIAPMEKVALASDCQVDRRRLFFVYSELYIQDGERMIRPMDNQNSGNILNPALANALAVVEPGENTIPSGEKVDVLEIRRRL